MKRIYEKPSLVMEKFETESILASGNIAFGETVQLEVNGTLTTINLNDNQMLQSIDYSDFK